MKILQWIRDLWKLVVASNKVSEAPIEVSAKNTEPPPGDDEMMAEVILRCWNSGNMVISNRDEKGNVTMTEHELKRPNQALSGPCTVKRENDA